MTANAAIGFWLILAAKLFGRLGGAAALETSKSTLTKKNTSWFNEISPMIIK